jgi:hypothetical protein
VSEEHVRCHATPSIATLLLIGGDPFLRGPVLDSVCLFDSAAFELSRTVMTPIDRAGGEGAGTAARMVLAAALSGSVLGVLVAVSPLTVIACVWLVIFCQWALRDVDPRERAIACAILGVAIAIRLTGIAVLFATSPHDHAVSFFWDGDGPFLKRRAALIGNIWMGRSVDPQSFFGAFDRSYGWTSYVYVVAYAQYLFGPAPFAIHLLHVAFFVTGAVLLFRIARPGYGPRAALGGLTLVLLLPTLAAWSMAALKESLYFLLCAVSIGASVLAIRTNSMVRRLAAGLVAIAAIAANDSVRSGAWLIVGGGIIGGLALTALARKPLLGLLVVMLLLSALAGAWRSPAVRARVLAQLETAAERHLGNVHTEGHAYKLLDQRIYSESSPPKTAVPTMTPIEYARFVVRALGSTLVVPLPWQASTGVEVVFLGQQAIWYLMVIFGFVGMWTGLSRDPLVTFLFVGVTVAGGTVIGLNNGNIGTLVRFRDTVVPFVCWLSALGGVTTLERCASRVHLGAASLDRMAAAVGAAKA